MDRDTLKQYLTEVAQEEIPDTMTVWTGIEAELASKPKRKRKSKQVIRPRWRYAAAASLIVMILGGIGFFGISPQGGNEPLMADLPDDQLTYLEESQTIDDVTVTLEWVYADVNRISLTYSVEHPASVQTGEFGGAVLETADGQVIPSAFGGGGGGGGGGNSPDAMVMSSSFMNFDAAVIDFPMDAEMADFVLTVQYGEPLENAMMMGGPGGGGGGGSSNMMATPEVAQVTPVRTFRFEINTPLIRAWEATPIADTVVSGNPEVEITLSDLSITPSMTRFTLCYINPTTDEGRDSLWEPFVMVDAPILMAMKAGLSATTFDEETGESCYEIQASTTLDPMTTELTITIESLTRSLPITQESAAEQEAMFADMGIDVTFDIFEGGGYGLGSGSVSVMNDEMSQQEAMQLINQLAFREQYDGTWLFPITIE